MTNDSENEKKRKEEIIKLIKNVKKEKIGEWRIGDSLKKRIVDGIEQIGYKNYKKNKELRKE